MKRHIDMVGLLWLGVHVLLSVAQGASVSPSRTTNDLNNPHKGFMLWATDYADGAPDNYYGSTVFHIYVPWREIEPIDQIFDWGSFETNHLLPVLNDYPNATFVLRPVADYPDGDNSGITLFYTGGEVDRDFPRFLIEAPLGITYWTYTSCDGDGPGWTPDWNDARLISQMVEFVTAFAAQYDGDPRITAVQVGLLGLWGEWHQSGCESHAPGNAAKIAIRDAYATHFTNTPIQIRYPRNPDAAGVDFGFHEDYFPSFTAPCIYGFPDCDDSGDWNMDYCFQHVITGAVNNWESNPISGESPNANQKRTWSNDFADVMTVIQDYHFSFLGPAGGHEMSGNQVLLNELKRNLGYNWHIVRCDWPDILTNDQSFAVSLIMTNSGSAPCYHDFPVELAVCSNDGQVVWSSNFTFQLSAVRPGISFSNAEVFTVSAVPPGDYSLRIGVIDPRIEAPGVRLQIAGEDAHIRYVMGDVHVANQPANYYVDPAGDDENPGSEMLPWQTLTNAAAQAGAGDTVYVRSGTYTERLVPEHSGSVGQELIFRAFSGEQPVIDGSGISLAEDEGMIDLSGRHDIRISGFYVCDSSGTGIYVGNATNIVIIGNITSNSVSSGIGVWRSENVSIVSNEVMLACNDGEQECITVAITDGFDVGYNAVHHGGPGTRGGEGIDAKDGSKNGAVHHNEVHHLIRLGIYVDSWDKPTTNIEVYANAVYECSSGYAVAAENGGMLADVRIYNNISYSNRYGMFVAGWGEAAPHPMRDIRIFNNTFANNWGSGWGGGIDVENEECTNIMICNNILSQNQSFQLAVESGVPWNQLTIEYNLIDGYRGYDPATETRGSNYLEGSARFYNAESADYRLQYGSPAIDAATALVAAADDFTGRLRPVNGFYDIGAFEHDNQTDDSDDDMMPDFWEVWFGLNPTNAADAMVDNDHDEFINRDEYLADTVPTNGDSYFMISNILISNRALISVVCSTARVYSLQGGGQLLDGSWADIEGQTNIPGDTMGTLELIDPSDSTGRYYRVGVTLP